MGRTTCRMRRRGVLPLVVALGALLPAPAVAGFTVFPTVIDLDGKRGQAATRTFNVRLRGETDHRFLIDVRDAVQQPDGSFALREATGSPFSASNWVSVSPRRFAGRPNRVQPVELHVLVPERAEPGDHLTSIIVTRIPAAQAGAVPRQAVSVRLTVRVAGRRRPGAEIAALDAPGVSDGNPVTVSALIRNTGNVRLDFDRGTDGLLALGQGSDRVTSLPFAGTVYPGQERHFELAWDEAPRFARLRATASMEIGEETVRESRSVLVLPWRQIAALLLVALAAAVIVTGRRRRRRA